MAINYVRNASNALNVLPYSQFPTKAGRAITRPRDWARDGVNTRLGIGTRGVSPDAARRVIRAGDVNEGYVTLMRLLGDVGTYLSNNETAALTNIPAPDSPFILPGHDDVTTAVGSAKNHFDGIMVDTQRDLCLNIKDALLRAETANRGQPLNTILDEFKANELGGIIDNHFRDLQAQLRSAAYRTQLAAAFRENNPAANAVTINRKVDATIAAQVAALDANKAPFKAAIIAKYDDHATSLKNNLNNALSAESVQYLSELGLDISAAGRARIVRQGGQAGLFQHNLTKLEEADLIYDRNTGSSIQKDVRKSDGTIVTEYRRGNRSKGHRDLDELDVLRRLIKGEKNIKYTIDNGKYYYGLYDKYARLYVMQEQYNAWARANHKPEAKIEVDYHDFTSNICKAIYDWTAFNLVTADWGKTSIEQMSIFQVIVDAILMLTYGTRFEHGKTVAAVPKKMDLAEVMRKKLGKDANGVDEADNMRRDFDGRVARGEIAFGVNRDQLFAENPQNQPPRQIPPARRGVGLRVP